MSHPSQNPPKEARHPFSLQIGRFSGIPIRLHITFLLFIAWIAVMDQRNAVAATLFIVVLFACVLFHEIGHALTAQIFGMHTSDITLYPIGGIARIEGEFEPKAEFWIALAGPLVNVVIAASIAIGFLIRHQPFPPKMWLIEPQNQFMASVFSANFMLAIFNLIPAFPMDGGRVLRSLLSMKLGSERGTKIAAIIGQFMAVALAIAGIFLNSIILLIIAIFIFFEAGATLAGEKQKETFQNHLVKEAMILDFKTILPGASVDDAAQMLLHGSQHDFPVVLGDEPLGILTRNAIIRGLAADPGHHYVADLMTRDFIQIEPDELLQDAVQKLQTNQLVPILVIQNQQLVGLLTAEKVNEFILAEHARANHSQKSLDN